MAIFNSYVKLPEGILFLQMKVITDGNTRCSKEYVLYLYQILMNYGIPTQTMAWYTGCSQASLKRHKPHHVNEKEQLLTNKSGLCHDDSLGFTNIWWLLSPVKAVYCTCFVSGCFRPNLSRSIVCFVHFKTHRIGDLRN